MVYAFGIELRMPFNEGLERLKEALSAEGLGVVSEVDVQSIMRNKLNEDIAPYRILGACAPGLAKRVMDVEPEAGALLPCSIVVREIEPELTGLTFMDPEAVLQLAENEAVAAAGRDARALIEAVRDRLSGQHPVDLVHHHG